MQERYSALFVNFYLACRSDESPFPILYSAQNRTYAWVTETSWWRPHYPDLIPKLSDFQPTNEENPKIQLC
jgi:hypothetical protein